MENFMGLLRVHVRRGVNLAVRDVCTSDPYVVIKLGSQRFKTNVVEKTVNPVWNDDLTLSIIDHNIPIRLTVYDYDVFKPDDPMGDAEFDIRTFVEGLRMDLSEYPNGTVLAIVQPSKLNCFAEPSKIYLDNGRVVQDLCLKLRNVECGKVILQIEWIDIPGCKGIGSS